MLRSGGLNQSIVHSYLVEVPFKHHPQQTCPVPSNHSHRKRNHKAIYMTTCRGHVKRELTFNFYKTSGRQISTDIMQCYHII